MHLVNLRAIGFAVLLAGGAASAFAGSIVSNFNTNSDGWTLADNDPDSTLTYVASGGNPGGYIVFNDAAEGTDDDFSAPAKFLGNDSGYLNGSLNFDLAHNEPAEDIGTTPLVITAMSGDTLSLILAAPATSSGNPFTWTSYNVALNTSSGLVFDGGTNSSEGFTPGGGTPATLNQIDAVLGDVLSIYVPADMHNGTEMTGLDNFSLTSAVPEPSSWGMLAGAGAGLFAGLRRRGGKAV